MVLKKLRLGLLCLALLLIVSAWFGIAVARTGLTLRSLQQGNAPLLYPQGAKAVLGFLHRKVLVRHDLGSETQAIAQIQKLPLVQQDAIAARFLPELQDEQKWQTRFPDRIGRFLANNM